MRIRSAEMKQFADKAGVQYLEKEASHEEWLFNMRGLEDEPEGGRRCTACFKVRLLESGRIAVGKGFAAFTTTLTVSPHKPADAVNAAGSEASRQAGIPFIDRDFKKRNGFRISCELSREAGLYRQSYCGCEFSSGKK